MKMSDKNEIGTPSAEAHEKALNELYCLVSYAWCYDHDWHLEIEAAYDHPDGLASYTSYVVVCSYCGEVSDDDILVGDFMDCEI